MPVECMSVRRVKCPLFEFGANADCPSIPNVLCCLTVAGKTNINAHIHEFNKRETISAMCTTNTC